MAMHCKKVYYSLKKSVIVYLIIFYVVRIVNRIGETNTNTAAG